jgi:hypothetical protein
MSNANDVKVLRELTKQYVEVANRDVVRERRDMWRAHNSLKKTKIPIHVRGFPEGEIPEMKCVCEDPFYRGHEHQLRWFLYQDTFDDDYVFTPWLTQRASVYQPPHSIWGVPIKHIPSPEGGRGSWMFDPPIKNLDDINKLAVPKHEIDEEDTKRNVEKLSDAVGDLITINIDRGPEWLSFRGDISTYLGHLRGLEQVFWDMMDNPEWLHSLLAFMRDGILKAQDEAEAAGDFRLCNNGNQAMPYAEELPLMEANSPPVTRDKLQTFMAAQEFTLISPEMHYEFLLQYQMPIMEKYGLVAYGCCEDLTEKIDMLRKVKNLRRIAVTPVANVKRCAEQIGTDYVISWRPNPAETVCCGFDPDHIREYTRQALEDSKGCYVDIMLKDIHTVEGQPERLREWVKITREVAEEYE